jgi:hypothetical protein
VPVLRGEPEKAVTFESLVEGPTAQATPEEAAAYAMRQAVQRWIDEPVPMLEGMSPRAAAKEPRLRPALLHLVKGEIRMQDQRNLEGGPGEDINWLPRELGLEELDIPAPPPRDLDEEDSELEWDKEAEARLGEAVQPLLLPEGTIPWNEAAEILSSASEPFATAALAMAWLAERGLDITAIAGEIAGAGLREDEFALAVATALPVALAFVRTDVDRDYSPIEERLIQEGNTRLVAMLKKLAASKAEPAEFASQCCSQPNLLMAASGFAAEADRKSGKRCRSDSFVAIVLLVAILIDELDLVRRTK